VLDDARRCGVGVMSSMKAATADNRISVLQVVLSLAPGGTERLVIETVRRLRTAYRMSVCCLDEPGEWGEMLRREGTAVFSLNRSPGFNPMLARRLADVAAESEASVLHCHQYSPFVYGSLARLLNRRLRVVFTEHGRSDDRPPSRKRRTANAVLGRIPDRIYSVSADLRRHMVHEGFQSGRIRVVLNGTEPGPLPDSDARLKARAALKLQPTAFVVGSVGRLDPVKNLSVLIRAFAQFAASCNAAKLVVVGDGPVREELEALAKACGVVSRIQFVGHRPDARELMAAFDVYVNTSIFEGISLTILEAMAAGKTVIATAVGGTPEVVVDGVTGVLCPPRNQQALVSALQRVAGTAGLLDAFGREGRRRVCEMFTLDRMIDGYAADYRELGENALCAG
jgi:L-malate glycosyltransferase